MKIIITENKFKDTIKLSLKELGTESTINNIGGWENFCNVMNIEGSIDFLHLFDDLEVVQSEKKENWTLFRYEKGNNLMIYDRKKKEVYISHNEIWSFLDNEFSLTNPVIRGVTKKWLDEVYNLKGITTRNYWVNVMTELG
jgi:histidyl-tRNA synthetase